MHRPDKRSRARAVRLSGLVLLTTLAITFGVRSVSENRRPCGDFGPLGRIPRYSIVFEPCIPAYVVRLGDDAPTVFVAEAAHMPDEPLEWDQTRRVFVSPFHGEEYSIEGERLSGPGQDRLRRCRVQIVRGRLRVDAPLGDPQVVRRACR